MECLELGQRGERREVADRGRGEIEADEPVQARQRRQLLDLGAREIELPQLGQRGQRTQIGDVGAGELDDLEPGECGERRQIDQRLLDRLVRVGGEHTQLAQLGQRGRSGDRSSIAVLTQSIRVSSRGTSRWQNRTVAEPVLLGVLVRDRLYDDLKSQGLTVSKDSLHAWLDHVQDAFVFFVIPIHTSSERVRQSNPRKVYAVDPGLVTACARRGSADLGQLLETAVFIELRRTSPDLAYARTQSGYEVDFVTPSGLVQACASIEDPATREREVRALREAMANLGHKEATIVTLAVDEEIRVVEGMVRVIPMWRWAIERAAS